MPLVQAIKEARTTQSISHETQLHHTHNTCDLM